MNEDKVKDIIGKLVLKNRLERQYPASKRNLAKLEELGLLKFMPTCNHPSVRGQIGQTDANRVIEEAGKAPGAVMNAYGEGEQTDGSDLWLALNETAETEDDDDDDNEMYTITLDGDGGHQTPAGVSGMAYSEGSEIVIWKDDEGWMSCISGVSADGNAYESDDFGPFDTKEEAEAFAREYVEAIDADYPEF